LLEVVGVARNSKYVWMTEAPAEYLYLPMSQYHLGPRILITESIGDPASLTGTLRELIRNLEPNMPVYDVRTMEEYFASWVVGSANLILFVVGGMGLTGLVLAMIGVHGVVAFSVSRRTREFGIRMAIGATKAGVLRMVLRRAALLCLAGITAGIAACIPASRVLRLFVFAAGTDWLSYVIVSILLVLVTMLASYGPARHASAIDPIKALRDALSTKSM
jgi:ABC-type antimicrobial peptide transport system permease subunit